MKRLRLCGLFLWLAAFSLCKCTRSTEVKAEEHLALQEEGRSEAQEHSTEVVQQGPETITTTVEEYAPAPEKATAPEGAVGAGATPRASSASPQATLPAVPILVKRTVTVDQRGPITDTKAENATQTAAASLSETQEQHSENETHTKWGLPWWLYVVGVGGLACAGWLLWKGGWLTKWITL